MLSVRRASLVGVLDLVYGLHQTRFEDTKWKDPSEYIKLVGSYFAEGYLRKITGLVSQVSMYTSAPFPGDKSSETRKEGGL